MTPRLPQVEFSLHSNRHQFRSIGPDLMLRIARGGHHHEITGPLGHSAHYPAVVRDPLDALKNGRRPITGIEDNLAALRIVKAVDRSAAQGNIVNLSG